MDTVIIITALLAAVALAATASTAARRRHPARLATAAAHEGQSAPAPTEPEISLVQVPGSDQTALVFGASPPSWLTVEPLLGATDRDRQDLVEGLAIGVGGGGAMAAGAQSLLAVQGLVRLTPETLAALQAFSPVAAANGANLGVLADSAGKFAHVVQWVPAGGAAGLSVVASAGTAVALVAIQVQLAQISKKVDKNIALTREVLDELRWSNEAEIIAVVSSIRRAYDEALSIGAVTEPIYSEIRGKEVLIVQARELLARRITEYTSELARARSRQDRRTWVRQHAERCLTDLRALMQVHQAWFVLQALRAANVADTDASAAGVHLVKILREKLTAENTELVGRMVDLADQLQRQLGLLEEAGNARLGRFRSAKEAREAAAAIRGMVVTTLPELDAVEPTSARVMLGEPEPLERACRLLRFIEGGSSQPELAIQCILQGTPGRLSSLWWDGSTSAFLFLTSDLLIVAREKSLLSDQQVDLRIARTDIQHVRITANDQHLEIRTAADTLVFVLPEAENTNRAQAEQILRSSPLAYYSTQFEATNESEQRSDQ